MNSRWQANRIGLINFWYYDDQEFPFARGRMLLRGSNGSGKSVTMQSIIPLLLDGNMSPERLDPFGSRDRKMSGYLLEENDERDERTGYLYLEFRREASDTFLTIGMGMRARRGKPVDKWYFSLTDGRRIGKDFFLYKKMEEKIPLTRRELDNRIGDGGRVFDRQQDYMAYVNQQIFGFETTEAYRDMIDLLIQLRTPKLSREFKPSVISEILSDSLQPLSDEDLRPMSEAIENMDTMSLNLKGQKEALEAARKIRQVLERYDRLSLYEKAKNYQETQRERKRLDDEKEQCCDERDERSGTLAELEQRRTELDARKSAMEKERESLRQSDAFALKEREIELQQRSRNEKALLEARKQNLQEKTVQKQTVREKAGQEQKVREGKKAELLLLLEAMQKESEDMSFDEHSFFSDELQQHFEEEYTFSFHQAVMEETRKKIEQGTELLKQADLQRRETEELIREKEQKERDEEGAERRVTELEMLMTQTCNEWKEHLYSWNSANRELKLPEETLREMARFVDSYSIESDFSAVRHLAADTWIDLDSHTDQELRKNRILQEECSDALAAVKEELKEWETSKDPEPPRSDAVLRNRKRLKEQNIPYIEFYRILDWTENTSPEICDRMEEALVQMGLLDALIVDEQYREQVLSCDPDSCDRYLFTGSPAEGTSLLEILQPDSSVDDLMKNHQILDILQSISFGGTPEGSDTWISGEGLYQIGILSGTVTGTVKASYLGVEARERRRQEAIRECRETIRNLEEELSGLEALAEGMEKRRQLLRQEYEAFPDDNDLQECVRMLDSADRELDWLRQEVRRLAGKAEEKTAALRKVMEEAGKIADGLHMRCSLEVFVQASEAVKSYIRNFYQLCAGHEAYLQLCKRILELEERIGELDLDIGRIAEEIRPAEQSLRQIQEELQSIADQLKLTDYEQIEERLEQCLQWLDAYPEQLRQCVAEMTRHQEKIRLLREKIQELEKEREILLRKEQYLGSVYREERKLGSVPLELPEESSPRQVLPLLFEKGKVPDRNSLIGQLNKSFFEHRASLNDYQPEMEELFAEMDEDMEPGWPSARRTNIRARYQGIPVSFHELIRHLEEDIQELEQLIRAGDRELFEDILSNIISRKIRGRINSSNAWVAKMNQLMGQMDTSSGLQFSLRWRSRTAESEDQMDTRELVTLLKKDYRVMSEQETERLSLHFRSKVAQARLRSGEDRSGGSFYQMMKEILDYRKWFEFQLFFRKGGEPVRELTNSVFGTFSGGEKAMAMYVPLFSSVAAKYQGGRQDAPRMIALDEAFAGVDSKNIRDMFRLMTEFHFDFIINSQVLWGDSDTLDALAIYQLIRPRNARFVTVMPYLWNGSAREELNTEQEVEERMKALEEQQ